MKLILPLICMLVSTSFLFSQSKLEDKLSGSKEQFILSKIDLGADHERHFKEIYEEYLERRNNIMTKKMDEFSAEKGKYISGEAELEDVMDVVFKYEVKEGNELNKLLKKLADELGGKTALKVSIIEEYLIEMEQLMLLEELPFMSESLIKN